MNLPVIVCPKCGVTIATDNLPALKTKKEEEALAFNPTSPETKKAGK